MSFIGSGLCFRLEIRQASEGFHHVPGIVEAKVENIKEVWNVLQAGNNARAVGSNNVNEHSSRPHWLVLPRTFFLLVCTSLCYNYFRICFIYTNVLLVLCI